MMIKKPRITIEHFLYMLVLLLALGVRFLNLASQPLSESEAEWAWQAFQLTQGEAAQMGDQPFYVLLTAFIFTLFGSSDFLARLLPALTGSVLVLLPFFYRDKLGNKAALVLAFAVAIDPMLVGFSRLAGGPILAFSFGLMAVTAWTKKSYVPAGVFGGLALLSGPLAVSGLIGFSLAWALSRIIGQKQIQSTGISWSGEHRTVLVALAGTLVLAGTLFLRIPQGLSALGNIIPSYFSGWISPDGDPTLLLAAVVVVYTLLAVIFALAAVVRSWLQPGNEITRWLTWWLLANLVLTLIYPSRQVADLVWVLAPMWILAALEIGRYLKLNPENDLISLGQTFLTILLLTFLGLINARLASNPFGNNLDTTTYIFSQPIIVNQQVISTLGILGMGVLSTILIGAGWSKRAAIKGLVWGISVFLGVSMLAVSWKLSILPRDTGNEFLYSDSVPGNTSQFLNTLSDFSEYSTGTRSNLDVVSQVDIASLRWVLRDYPNARFSSSLKEEESPAAVITREFSQDPKLSAFYRGQRFVWSVSPDWDGKNFSRWRIFREPITLSESLILWLRADVFPGDLTPTQTGQPAPDQPGP